jgi:uncharacterized protein YdcH (DUF465 family)
MRDSKSMSVAELKAEIAALKASKARLVAAVERSEKINSLKRRRHREATRRKDAEIEGLRKLDI